MVDLVDGLLLSHQPSIARVEARPSQMIQQWLGAGTFVPSLSTDSKRLVLGRVGWESLMEAMASDIDRLSKAGRETLQVTRCVDGMPKASAWILIQAYYASYYFAQSILRLCGVVPSYFQPNELQKLSRICSAYTVHLPFPLSGQFLIEVDNALKIVVISRDNSASHEATWNAFKSLLENIEKLLRNSGFSQADQLDIADDIQRVKLAISNAGGTQSKLSTTRNNIQYRQELGGWSPYAGAAMAEDLKRRITSSLSTRSNLHEYEITHHSAQIKFLECCLIVCTLGRSLLNRLNEIYGSKFLRLGFCKLDRQYGMLD